MAKSNDRNDDIHQKLDKICENQLAITNYLHTLNQFVMYSHFNVTEQFSDVLSALKFGSSLMIEQLESVKSENSIENHVKEIISKKEKDSNETETSDIFSKFPHSALITPQSFSGSSNNRKGMVDCSPVSTSSLSEFYENLAKAPGTKAFNRNFPAILRSPNLSLVAEVSNTSVSEKSSAPTSQSSSIISPITIRKHKNRMPLSLTPVPSEASARSRRAAAPSSLKEPSLKNKMRRK